MLEGINLEQIRVYNNTLKQYKDKAASLKAEMEYTNKELDSLCAELTAELGVQVTRDNINQIYEDQINKINSTLNAGTAVLTKIASEEQNGAVANSNVAPQPVPQPSPVVAPQPVPQPVPGVVPPMPQMSNDTVQTTAPIFNSQGQPSELPKMFSI